MYNKHVRKLTISKLFLYRYRFIIGYALLGLAYITLLFALPAISPKGLSDAEMESAVTSYNLHFSSITAGDLVDLPYHILQKFCLGIFGFSIYSIKLPSIIIGLFLGFLLILLLNRWFKSNVALFASILIILSTPFLYLAGSGTPLIMLVFWPAFLLWLGSKIQGIKRPRVSYCLIFAVALLLSVFTPHLIYLVAFIVFYALYNPHLRFTIRSLPKVPFILTSLVVLAGLGLLGVNIFSTPGVAAELFLAKDFSLGDFFGNIATAFSPYFSWNNSLEGVYLSPFIGLGTFFIAFVGLISTTKGFFASRNAIASYLVVFTILLSGFNPDSAVLLILPFAILVAHGLRYVLEKWYGLFPENPYARIFGVLPISVFLGIIIISGLTHYIYGYRYNPSVATQFSSDLRLVDSNLTGDNIMLLADAGTLEYDFYQSYADATHRITVISELPTDFTGTVATLGKRADFTYGQLSRIITSPKSDNSDRIYIYSAN